jgi:hypothetical protein
MLTPAERQRVWHNLYTSEVRNHYYARLSGRYQRQGTALTWFNLVLSGGAAGTFVSSTIAKPYPFVPPMLAIVSAGISAYSLLAKKERKGIDASKLSQKYSQLAHKFDIVFGRMKTTTSSELEKLEEERTAMGEAAHTLAFSKSLMRQSQDDVRKARNL